MSICQSQSPNASQAPYSHCVYMPVLCICITILYSQIHLKSRKFARIFKMLLRWPISSRIWEPLPYINWRSYLSVLGIRFISGLSSWFTWLNLSTMHLEVREIELISSRVDSTLLLAVLLQVYLLRIWLVLGIISVASDWSLPVNFLPIVLKLMAIQVN